MEHKSKYGGQPEIMAAVFSAQSVVGRASPGYDWPVAVFQFDTYRPDRTAIMVRVRCDNDGRAGGDMINLLLYQHHYDLRIPSAHAVSDSACMGNHNNHITGGNHRGELGSMRRLDDLTICGGKEGGREEGRKEGRKEGEKKWEWLAP